VVHGTADRPPAEEPRIVVGIDGSATSDATLRWAVEEAEHRGAVMEVVHAWQPPSYPYLEPINDPNKYEVEAKQLLDAAVEGLPTTARATKTFAIGGASRAILDAGQGADLIVVGARGIGGFERFVLGSTSQQVVHHAHCPVVVIPGVAPR
jgi:nucleotide-binding universal stress UspA family protein